MVLVVVLAALLLLFLIMRHNVGLPFLAMIAGVAVYENFGAGFAEVLHDWFSQIDVSLAQQGLYALFVILVPLLLYLRAGRSGLFGVLRIIENVVFASMLTILASSILVDYFSFDNTSVELAGWLEGVRGYLMVIGVIMSYVDVFLFRAGRVF